MKKEKENAIKDFNNMIKKSWTYGKMTTEERERWGRVLESVQTREAVKGTYSNRWEVLQAIYNSYLLALDYCWNWREEDQERPF